MAHTEIVITSEHNGDKELIRRMLACYRWATAHRKYPLSFSGYVKEVLGTGVSFHERIILDSCRGKTIQ